MNAISRDPQVRGGQPVLQGTRFPVCRLIAELAEGQTIDEIVDDLDLDLGLAKAALNELALELEKGSNYGRMGT